MTPVFEFEPFRHGLYSAEELLAGFIPTQPETYGQMRDVQIYREYVAGGGSSTSDYLTAMSRSLHDNGITQHLADRLGTARTVAIMGGHSAKRSDTAYVDAARLASRLTAKGLLVLSGGGPGAMEATHIGAIYGGDVALEATLTAMKGWAAQAIPPKSETVINPDFTINMAKALELGTYLAPAVELLRSIGKGGAGVGVPTWMYGFEPFTPFAGSIAKYFQNSIREDGLLALATQGIVYVEGGPGTLQEVFQDAAQNYYHTFPSNAAGSGYFSPMVFFGDFWTATMHVQVLFDTLFKKPPPGGAKNDHWEEFSHLVKFTKDFDEAVEFLAAFTPPIPNQTLAKLRAGPAA